MTKRLDSDSRDVLEFRPNIAFVEPDVGPGVIDPVSVPGITVEETEARVDRVRKLAEAVDVLASAIQEKANKRAENFKIKLDANADGTTIAAMRRLFPGEDPTTITYQQYSQLKSNQLAHSTSIADKILVTPDDVEQARKQQNLVSSTSPLATPAVGVNATGVTNADLSSGARNSMFGTDTANTGLLRPEVWSQLFIVPPVDITEIQDVLIRILVNFIWKNFVKPAIASMGPMGQFVHLAPDEIAPLPEGFQIPDITNLGTPVLGEEPPKWMTKAPPEIPTSIDALLSQKQSETGQDVSNT